MSGMNAGTTLRRGYIFLEPTGAVQGSLLWHSRRVLHVQSQQARYFYQVQSVRRFDLFPFLKYELGMLDVRFLSGVG